LLPSVLDPSNIQVERALVPGELLTNYEILEVRIAKTQERSRVNFLRHIFRIYPMNPQ